MKRMRKTSVGSIMKRLKSSSSAGGRLGAGGLRCPGARVWAQVREDDLQLTLLADPPLVITLSIPALEELEETGAVGYPIASVAVDSAGSARCAERVAKLLLPLQRQYARRGVREFLAELLSLVARMVGFGESEAATAVAWLLDSGVMGADILDLRPDLDVQDRPWLNADTASEITVAIISHLQMSDDTSWDEKTQTYRVSLQTMLLQSLDAWGIDTSVPLQLDFGLIDAGRGEGFSSKRLAMKIQQDCKPSTQVPVLAQLVKITNAFLKRLQLHCHEPTFGLAKMSMPSSASAHETALSVEETLKTFGSLPSAQVPQPNFYADRKLTCSAAVTIVSAIRYLMRRLLDLQNYCAICDQPLEDSRTAEGADYAMGLQTHKPRVCSRPLCLCQNTEADMDRNIDDSPPKDVNQEVLDLLTVLFSAAASSSRREFVCRPFPSLCIKPQDQNSEHLDWDSLHATVGRIQAGDIPLESLLEGKTNEVEASQLAKWLWKIHPFRLEKLDANLGQTFCQVSAPQQYAVIAENRDKEQRFQERRRQHGSFFAFHGSRLENWHSILSSGLKVMSNTQGMVNGASYGPGIYLTTDLRLASRYSGKGQRSLGRNSYRLLAPLEQGSRLMCLGLCEVAGKPECLRKREGIVVVDDDELVSLRFLFVWREETDVPSLSREVGETVFAQARSLLDKNEAAASEPPANTGDVEYRLAQPLISGNCATSPSRHIRWPVTCK